MNRTTCLSLLGVLASLVLLAACSETDNDVGTIPHGGGGARGTGGAGGGSCTDSDGKTYAVGDTFKKDCNTCGCGFDGIWCTLVLCLHTGGAPGSTGTGGISGGGGGGGLPGSETDGGARTPGTGGTSDPNTTGVGYCTGADGKIYAVGEGFKQDCNSCTCLFMGDEIGMVLACTVMACVDASVDAPAGTQDGPLGSEAAGVPDGLCLLSYNDALVPDGTDPCCYQQGGASTCNTAIKCNERSGPDCCLIYGAENTSYGYRCCLYANGAPVDGAEECRQLLAATPAAVPSACPACGADELCVAYYDGTCQPMQSSCRKVTDTTRQSILVKHERCFGKPIGDEICGTQNGQHFWGCGEPPCPNEPLASDINCYGP